jgi:deazaflavin-dependent oxidoreductase (nitroreductase family)
MSLPVRRPEGIRSDTARLTLIVMQLPELPDTLTRDAFRALNRIVIPALARGIGNPLPIGAGAVVVETTGRVSGEPRRVPLLSLRFGDQLLVSTVRDDSQWFANLEADPSARVQLSGRFRESTARVTRGPLNVALLTAA